jgi:hypothetical protein
MLCLWLIQLLSATACRAAPASGAVASVNGVEIGRVEYDEMLRIELADRESKKGPATPEIERKLRRSVLFDLVDDLILVQAARAARFSLSGPDLQTELSRFETDHGGSAGLRDYLRQIAVSPQRLRAHLERIRLAERYAERLATNQEVSEEELRASFRESERRRERAPVIISRILISLPPDASKEVEAASEALAMEIQHEAAQPGADFAAIARRHSQGPEVQSSGRLRVVMLKDLSSEEKAMLAAAPEAGALSAVQRTPEGFEMLHLSVLGGRDVRTFEELRSELREQLVRQKAFDQRAEAVGKLWELATIEQYIECDRALK